MLIDLFMLTKDVLETAIEEVKKERDWILLESRYIQKLRYAVKIRDFKQTRRFERKAARSERRVHQSEERVLEIIDSLRQIFPAWSNALYILEQKTRIYERNILRRVSSVDGTIPNLIKQNDFDQINIEIDKVMNEGIRPLIALLDHLEKEIKKKLEKVSVQNLIAEQMEKEEPSSGTEAYLRRQPFLIVFHSANEREYANKILASRYDLPQSYMGRRIEYAFEVDYFWIEHNGRISGFLGHAPHGMIPRNAKKILEMRRGKTDAESVLKRKGLLFPKWMFSRIGRIKLMIEIKAGWGNDARALDELVKMIRSYHLQNSIILIAFSAWPLLYLKQHLPNALTVLIVIRVPILGRLVLPLNRPLQSLRSFGLFVPNQKLSFVDVIDTPSKKSEKGIARQIRQAADDKKLFIGGRVNSREKFDWLIKYGARGGIMWKDPRTIIQWLSTPPTVRT